jgi:acyl-CoA synthetase (AMP-forming)/AMP-acid ligase II
MSTEQLSLDFTWLHPSEIPFVRPDLRAPAVADARCELSTSELAEEIRRVAGGLAGLGVGPGDVVATMLPNRAEVVTTLFAAWQLGAALTPVNPALTVEEAGYQLSDSSAAVVVVDDASAQVLAGSGARHLHVDDLALMSGEAPPRSPAADDVALLIYTSGTTGRPKGVVLDHANVTAMVAMLAGHFRMGPSERALVALPLFHVNGLVVSVLTPLAVGGSTVILERFSKSSFWDEVERARPTFFSLVPAMYLMFNDLPDEVRPDTSSLRFCICGAAPVPAQALTAFKERYGVPIVEAYGLSETTVGVSINPLDGPQKPGSVGPALRGLELRIVDDHDRPLPQGERGEVVVSGPNVMRGYLGRPDETADALNGGWLRTGDVGYLDEADYLFLVDRKKDLIIRGGENIYPTELEHVLAGHPAIREVAVVGKPDPVMGEEPVAFAALKEGSTTDEQELLAFAKQRLAGYKLPEEVRFVEELPRNAVGKVAKPELRERVRR